MSKYTIYQEVDIKKVIDKILDVVFEKLYTDEDTSYWREDLRKNILIDLEIED